MREARSSMLLGSALAGMAFANAPVAAVHALLLSAVRKPQRTAADAARKDAVVERLPRALWAGVWGVVEGAVDEAVDEYAAHEKMLCRLLAHFLEAYDGARTRQAENLLGSRHADERPFKVLYH